METNNSTTPPLPAGLFRDAETGRIALIRCPKCHAENYAPNVMSGRCTWCGYNANEAYAETHKTRGEGR